MLPSLRHSRRQKPSPIYTLTNLQPVHIVQQIMITKSSSVQCSRNSAEIVPLASIIFSQALSGLTFSSERIPFLTANARHSATCTLYHDVGPRTSVFTTHVSLHLSMSLASAWCFIFRTAIQVHTLPTPMRRWRASSSIQPDALAHSSQREMTDGAPIASEQDCYHTQAMTELTSAFYESSLPMSEILQLRLHSLRRAKDLHDRGLPITPSADKKEKDKYIKALHKGYRESLEHLSNKRNLLRPHYDRANDLCNRLEAIYRQYQYTDQVPPDDITKARYRATQHAVDVRAAYDWTCLGSSSHPHQMNSEDLGVQGFTEEETPSNVVNWQIEQAQEISKRYH